MADKDQSRAPSNELDMDAYHSEGIDPGEHKVFNITPTIHSFNERFQGEPPVSAGPGLDKYNPDEMPPWWVKVIKPNTQWPGEGLNYEPEPMPGNSTFNTITKDAFFQPISDKGPKPPLSIPELDIPLVHKPSINKDVFNPAGAYGNRYARGVTTNTRPRTYTEHLKTMVAGGSSNKEIAESLGIKPNSAEYTNLQHRLSNYRKIYKNLDKEDVPDWFKEEMEHTDPLEGLSSKDLSNWMKNQFEGGPVEGQFRGMEAANDNLGRKTYNLLDLLPYDVEK